MTVRKMASLLLSLMIAAGVILTGPTAAARAEETAPVIMLGAGEIAKETAVARNHTIWFGKFDNKNYPAGPVQWRVLSGGASEDPDDEMKLPVSCKGEALLISSQVLVIALDFGYNQKWAGSLAQKWCTNLWKSSKWLTAAEKSAVNATTVKEKNISKGEFYRGGFVAFRFGAAPLNKERFFFLSAREADKLFTDDEDRKAENPEWGPWWWYLRSPLTIWDTEVGEVNNKGEIHTIGYDLGFGARPAFNLKLSAVLFCSAAEGGKSIAAENGAVRRIPSGSQTEWKLTLRDKNRDGFSSSAASLSGSPGGTITIPYSGAKKGSREYVSILVCSEDGKTALCYGSCKISAEKGKAAFVLPGDSDLPAGSYTVMLFNECRNGRYQSDYAGKFVKIPLTVSEPVN